MVWDLLRLTISGSGEEVHGESPGGEGAEPISIVNYVMMMS